MSHTVLLPIDHEQETNHIAADYAVQISDENTTIHVLHVNNPHVVPHRENPPKVVTETKTYLENKDAPVNEITFTVTPGEADEIITEFAAEHDCDVIVMTTNAKTGFSRLITGSVTESVVRTAPCPVYTISPNAHDTPHPQ